MQDKIIIKGAREHNLKNISLEIPRNKMVVFTGVSGSGKSSLAFDTIFAEGQRRYVESLSAYARQFLGQMQKPDVDEIEGLSPAISIDQKAHSANPRSTVATITEVYDYLRVLYARIGVPYCPVCGKIIRKMTVEEMVDSVGKAAKKLLGTGKAEEIHILAPAVRGRKGEYYQMLYDWYNSGFLFVRVDGKMRKLSGRILLDKNKKHTIELVTDIIPASDVLALGKENRQRLAESLEVALEYGNNLVTVIFGGREERSLSAKFSCPDDGFSFPEIEPRLFSFNSPYGACPTCHGIGTEFIYSDEICPDCNGKRLRREALNVLINGKNINELVSMDIDLATRFILSLNLTAREKEIAGAAMKEILDRLQFMIDVGVEYLTLDRTAGTLSGGEAQRIRLASQVGSRLVGALYVLDEPTIGLHQKDNTKLIETLANLRDIGNTIIVVEHDEETIRAADYLVDFGPGAGKRGGEVVCCGEIPEIFKNTESSTCAYLRRDKEIPLPAKRRAVGRDAIKIIGAKEHNLKGLNLEIPLRRFICVTGVSGSGKSSLMYDVVYKYLANRLNGTGYRLGAAKQILGLEYLDKAILIDQSAIGRTPRSNPATYTGTFSHIRDLFTQTPEAKFRGYRPGRFSFNVPGPARQSPDGSSRMAGGGRCEHCEGHGYIAIEMHFLPTVYVTCEVCKGKRFDRETLEVKWKEKNISQVLDMEAGDAYEFFKDIPLIADRLKVMNEVGLGYMELGQPATTLSGGEAQRVKLANELAKRPTGRTFYLLDEPTTGLHFEDIKKLLEVLHRLVDRGNSVVVIEHNLDVIKTADWVIDLGPEGGDRGGSLVAQGTPEDIAANPKSYTGQYLKKVLR
ncbi:MAG: excinuclease ABC subunit UvrA [Patescibacteria group bacterium]|nr:excinuclease ABC subunit UvrA [Patescibacteria group bacterium]